MEIRERDGPGTPPRDGRNHVDGRELVEWLRYAKAPISEFS